MVEPSTSLTPEQTLRESDEHLQLALDAAKIGAFEWVSEGRRISLSEISRDVFGLLPGRPFSTEDEGCRLVHPDDRERLRALFEQAAATGGNYHTEYRIIRPRDGRVAWIEERAQATLNPATGASRVRGVHWDITDRKRAEELLLLNERRQAFLLQLGDALHPLSNAADIQAVATRLLGQYAGASRAGYAEPLNDNWITVTRDYTDGVPSLQGSPYRFDDYGPGLTKEFRAGRTVVRPDIAHDSLLSDAEKQAHAALHIGATLNKPILRGGRLQAVLFLNFQAAHPFSHEEITLLEETAERTWTAIERVRAEEAVRVSDRRYRTLFDSIDEGFCLIEVLFRPDGAPCDYRFLEANPAFEQHTGLKNAVGRTILELAPHHDAHWFEIYGRIARTGKPERFEERAEALGRYYDVYAFRVEEPEKHRVAVLFNDIAERKNSAEAVAADLHDLHDIQLLRELGARPTSETDPQDLYDAINAAAMQLAHADAGTVQIYDAETNELVLLATRGFPGDSRRRFGRVSAASATSCGVALRSGERTFLDFDDPAQPDPKGDLRWHVDAGYLSAQSTPLVARSGRPIGMLSTHWCEKHRRPTERELRYLDLLARQAADLIEQRQADASLRAALAASKAAGEAKDHFLAVLSHELRTPLSPVVMTTEALQRRSDLDPALRHGLDMIQRNVKLECRLIDDLLDVTRIVRGRLEILREPFDLHHAIRGALDVTRPDLEKKRQRFHASLHAIDTILTGDAARLQQTVWNLLKNASKFTPEQGEIFLFTRNVNHSIEVKIRDTGVGIAPERLAAIFEAFAQADESVSRRFGGLGLGLAIARATIDAHGGSIHAESDGPGLGATFTFILPLATSPASGPLNGPAGFDLKEITLD